MPIGQLSWSRHNLILDGTLNTSICSAYSIYFRMAAQLWSYKTAQALSFFEDGYQASSNQRIRSDESLWLASYMAVSVNLGVL